MRNLVFNNFGLKVFSLVLAVLLWFVIKTSLPPEARQTLPLLRMPAKQEFQCPVLALRSPANAQALRVLPADVTVTLSGNALVLRRLQASDIQVFIKLPDAGQSQGVFPVEVKLPPDFPPDVRFVDVQPAQVSLSPLSSK